MLVVGDPFGATTHTDVIIRAKEMNIKYQVIHNASIMNAIGCCGLQLYNFGETISIPYWSDTWQPDSFYDKIKINRDNGLHTLCLLGLIMNCLLIVAVTIRISSRKFTSSGGVIIDFQIVLTY